MAYESTVLTFTWPAGADLSAKQYCAMQLTTVSGVEVVTTADATVRVIGILQNDPTSGAEASIGLVGISRMLVDGSGAAIAAQDAIAPNASGIGVKTITDNDEIVAYALQPSTAANDVIAVLLAPLRRY